MLTQKDPADGRYAISSTLPPASALQCSSFRSSIPPFCKTSRAIFTGSILVGFCCLSGPAAHAQTLTGEPRQAIILVENDLAHGKFDAHSWQPASLYDAKKSSTIQVSLPAKPVSPTIIAIDSPEAIERNMHLMGTSLLNAQKSREAIKLLKLCTAMNPQSWNSYNSLGEAYARTGNKKLAIRSYKKAIKLNPDNVSARQAILKLKQ